MLLKLDQVSVTYRNGVKALDTISFEIGTGMYGLLGPNGAGKSTLMRTIATLQLPDSGTLFFGNTNVLTQSVGMRKRLGYLPQDFGVYPKISAEHLLDYFALLKGISSKKERRVRIRHVLELTNLYESRKKYVDSYSGGMKQRFGIAQMLLGNPELIIVDEPTSGLDPEERRRFIHIIRELSVRKTVIFSTHIVEDIEGICHEVLMIDRGRLKLKSTVSDAVESLRGKIWLTPGETPEGIVLSRKYSMDNTVSLRVYATGRPHGDCRPAPPTLEDVFLLMTRPDEERSLL